MDYLSLLPPSARAKPRFTALVSAVLDQVNDLLDLYSVRMPEAFSLSAAEGFQLDTIGLLAGFPRPSSGTSDEDYRSVLRAKIAAARWNGTNEDLPRVLAQAFPDQAARMTDNLDGTVTLSLSGGAPFPLETLFPVPAGIRAVKMETGDGSLSLF